VAGSRKGITRRFTPTGVGTTTGIGVRLDVAQVHPHGRGDNEFPSLKKRFHPWFTPTGVGTTNTSITPGVSITVHPHGRGDNVAHAASFWAVQGSPPRAWGQRTPNGRIGTADRFTPTGVGTTIATGTASNCAPVHPHGRGDNPGFRGKSRFLLGSPPRAWGQQ